MSSIKELFFSEGNILLLQKTIVSEIYSTTGKRIPFQKPESVFTMMRYTFTNHALNTCDPNSELEYLNKKFISIVLPNIVNSIEQYLKYIQTISNIDNGKTTLLNYPQQTNIKRSQDNKSFDYSVPNIEKSNTIFSNNNY